MNSITNDLLDFIENVDFAFETDMGYLLCNEEYKTDAEEEYYGLILMFRELTGDILGCVSNGDDYLWAIPQLDDLLERVGVLDIENSSFTYGPSGFETFDRGYMWVTGQACGGRMMTDILGELK